MHARAIHGWLLVAGLACVDGGGAFAAPITVSGVFNIREQRTANSLMIGAGDRVRFGAVDVQPNGAGGTTGVAVQAGVVRDLLFQPSPASPNFFNNATSNVSLVNPWTLTFTNGGDSATVDTPSAAATPPPFVRSVTISGSGTTPTISWVVPDGYVPDAARITIYDKELSDAAGFAVGIFGAGIAATNTTFTVPAGVLSLDRPEGYVFEVSLLDLHNPAGPTGNSNQAGRSRSFFGFNPLAPGAPDDVFLPIVDEAGVFHFDFDVTADERVFIDPLVAVGYDYRIGGGDPNFASVLLPDIGDGVFDLFLLDGSEWVFDRLLHAGTAFDFAGAGVAEFRIAGIEASAGLRPEDPTAFVTGLTFVGDGRFTGTMTPLTAELRVSEPATLWLVALALAAVAGAGRRRSSNVDERAEPSRQWIALARFAY
jgi:hypothetical protein